MAGAAAPADELGIAAGRAVLGLLDPLERACCEEGMVGQAGEVVACVQLEQVSHRAVQEDRLAGGVHLPQPDGAGGEGLEALLGGAGGLLGVCPLDELRELAPHRLHQLEQRLVGAAHLPAEELHHAEDAGRQQDRERERGVQPEPRGVPDAIGAGEAGDVVPPDRAALGPGAAGDPDADREGGAIAGRLEGGGVDGVGVPHGRAPEAARGAVDAPHGSELPPKGAAQAGEDARRSVGQRGGRRASVRVAAFQTSSRRSAEGRGGTSWR